MELNQFVADVVKRGYGEIDLTQRHTLPPRQRHLPGIEADDPIVNAIVRRGIKLDIALCHDCGAPFSLPIEEEGGPFLCSSCGGDGDDDEQQPEEMRR